MRLAEDAFAVTPKAFPFMALRAYHKCLSPVARPPEPDVPAVAGMTGNPDRAGAFGPRPVPFDPDPGAGAHDVLSANPDVESAWRSRTGDNHDRWWGRRAVNFDLRDLDGNRIARNDDTA